MRIFSLQGWELIRKSDEKDSSVMLRTRKEKKTTATRKVPV